MTTSTDRAPGLAGADLLIDRFLPEFDVTLIEHVVVEAEVGRTWQAVRDLDLTRVHTPLMDAAMFVRGVPAGVARRFGRAGPAEQPAELKLFGPGTGLPGWLSLGEAPGQEVVLGAIGRFWQPDIEWYDVTGMTPEQFAGFTEPGWGRIAAGFSLRPYGTGRTLVSYEARTATDDPASARRFSRYWSFVRPFVRIVMRATLARIREDAESVGASRTEEAPAANPIHRWERWLYRGGRPHPVARVLNRGAALAYSAGVLPHRLVTLEVPGRRSGKLVTVPLVVADHEGERYLVAMLGADAQWVRNVRAAHGDVVLRHGTAEDVHLEEVPVELRAPVLRRYLACAPGGRAHIPVDRRAPIEEFARIAPDIPVFRVVARQAES
ncbi:nitroreductase/quinone reductase family protein [Amycolatopsis mongoliensis]|uniref:Nitroreductase/quinone reductase family protein n=1 Tax=Amycolatopsis mongoliensis TaxID=715475 RepID=A0A9Y2JKH8_9PSEU|nr:nitroreductase/quinone reductase family protein [Amycolatopsis sp. 4-36]WIX98518.1 nitroreductase/quinone reductase family protein [Amycolatopsis sp. 4-36]